MQNFEKILERTSCDVTSPMISESERMQERRSSLISSPDIPQLRAERESSIEFLAEYNAL